MKISIVNMTKRLQVDFLSSADYKQETGYDPSTHYYSKTSFDTGYIWLQTWSGLASGGSSVSNTTLKAINTNGEYFAGNSWGPTTFTINFAPLNDLTFQRLNECIKYKNEPLYVQIETDRKYYMWCIVDDGSGIEQGELTFVSALDGTGTYWSTGDKEFVWNPKAGFGLVQSGAQNILGTGVDNSDPDTQVFTIKRFVTGEQLPIIKIELDEAYTFKLTHVNSGTVYTDNPEYGVAFPKYVFNSRDRTTTISGIPQTYNTDYVQFTGGDEMFHLELSKGIDPSKIKITITYEELFSTVYGG